MYHCICPRDLDYALVLVQLKVIIQPLIKEHNLLLSFVSKNIRVMLGSLSCFFTSIAFITDKMKKVVQIKILHNNMDTHTVL
jgi:hypothetical protein